MAKQENNGREKQTITKSDVAMVDASALVKLESKAMAAYDYGEDMVPIGKIAPGYEGQSSQDASMPWIVLLQPMSPAVAQGKVEGAKAGMFMNTVTHQLWGAEEGVIFVPSTTRHEFVQWVDRDNGGGLVARHEIDSEVVATAKKKYKFAEYKTPGENGQLDDLVETFYVIGVVCDPDGSVNGEAMIGLTSTKIKPYKDWIAMIRAFTLVVDGNKYMPPLYSHIAKMTSKGENFGKDFAHVVKIAPLNGAVKDSLVPKEDERFIRAKALKLAYESGAAKIDYSAQGGKGEAGGSASGSSGSSVPF